MVFYETCLLFHGKSAMPQQRQLFQRSAQSIAEYGGRILSIKDFGWRSTAYPYVIGKLTEQWNHDSNLLRHHTEKVDFFKGYKNRSSYYPTNATGMQVLARRGGAAASDAKTAARKKDRLLGTPTSQNDADAECLLVSPDIEDDAGGDSRQASVVAGGKGGGEAEQVDGRKEASSTQPSKQPSDDVGQRVTLAGVGDFKPVWADLDLTPTNLAGGGGFDYGCYNPAGSTTRSRASSVERPGRRSTSKESRQAREDHGRRKGEQEQQRDVLRKNVAEVDEDEREWQSVVGKRKKWVWDYKKEKWVKKKKTEYEDAREYNDEEWREWEKKKKPAADGVTDSGKKKKKKKKRNRGDRGGEETNSPVGKYDGMKGTRDQQISSRSARRQRRRSRSFDTCSEEEQDAGARTRMSSRLLRRSPSPPARGSGAAASSTSAVSSWRDKQQRSGARDRDRESRHSRETHERDADKHHRASKFNKEREKLLQNASPEYVKKRLAKTHSWLIEPKALLTGTGGAARKEVTPSTVAGDTTPEKEGKDGAAAGEAASRTASTASKVTPLATPTDGEGAAPNPTTAAGTSQQSGAQTCAPQQPENPLGQPPESYGFAPAGQEQLGANVAGFHQHQMYQPQQDHHHLNASLLYHANTYPPPALGGQPDPYAASYAMQAAGVMQQGGGPGTVHLVDQQMMHQPGSVGMQPPITQNVEEHVIAEFDNWRVVRLPGSTRPTYIYRDTGEVTDLLPPELAQNPDLDLDILVRLLPSQMSSPNRGPYREEGATRTQLLYLQSLCARLALPDERMLATQASRNMVYKRISYLKGLFYERYRQHFTPAHLLQGAMGGGGLGRGNRLVRPVPAHPEGGVVRADGTPFWNGPEYEATRVGACVQLLRPQRLDNTAESPHQHEDVLCDGFQPAAPVVAGEQQVYEELATGRATVPGGDPPHDLGRSRGVLRDSIRSAWPHRGRYDNAVQARSNAVPSVVCVKGTLFGIQRRELADAGTAADRLYCCVSDGHERIDRVPVTAQDLVLPLLGAENGLGQNEPAPDRSGIVILGLARHRNVGAGLLSEYRMMVVGFVPEAALAEAYSFDLLLDVFGVQPSTGRAFAELRKPFQDFLRNVGSAPGIDDGLPAEAEDRLWRAEELEEIFASKTDLLKEHGCVLVWDDRRSDALLTDAACQVVLLDAMGKQRSGLGGAYAIVGRYSCDRDKLAEARQEVLEAGRPTGKGKGRRERVGSALTNMQAIRDAVQAACTGAGDAAAEEIAPCFIGEVAAEQVRPRKLVNAVIRYWTGDACAYKKQKICFYLFLLAKKTAELQRRASSEPDHVQKLMWLVQATHRKVDNFAKKMAHKEGGLPGAGTSVQLPPSCNGGV
eukprot:g12273.t1